MRFLLIAFLWVMPSVDRIDYLHPQKYLATPSGLGRASSLKPIAASIRGANDEAKLRAIAAWLQSQLRVDDHQPNVWREFDAIVRDRKLASCADTALVFGTVARAIGIPTIWVESMDIDWIRAFKAYPKNVGTWSGHVFVESFVDGKWRLIDPTQSIIYDDYDPKNRLLPGNRFAYDKGDDPNAMLMSLHGQAWREKTAAYFKTFDARSLPVSNGRPLLRRLHAIADDFAWPWIEARANQLGVRRANFFTAHFERWLPEAAGHYLLLTATANRFSLPPQYRDAYSPLSSLQLNEALKQRESGRADRTLSDGTRVILLYARDENSLHREIDRLQLEP